jgi:hypothetical protein
MKKIKYKNHERKNRENESGTKYAVREKEK